MGINQTKYDNRDDYIKHQKSKTKAILNSAESTQALYKWNMKYRRKLRAALDYEFIKPGTSVLCLGARAGGEVKAFIDKGCFAVGVDLLPTPGSSHVVVGDFNNLHYADESIDVVFTNSLDHSDDLAKTVSETCRVLKADGHFLVEIMSDEDDWRDQWACCHWDFVKDVIAVITKGGFCMVSEVKMPSAGRLFGTQLCFKKV